jgi:hypothetical protein
MQNNKSTTSSSLFLSLPTAGFLGEGQSLSDRDQPGTLRAEQQQQHHSLLTRRLDAPPPNAAVIACPCLPSHHLPTGLPYCQEFDDGGLVSDHASVNWSSGSDFRS